MKSDVYFYPHPYLRDRQLDTIRCWAHSKVVNPELARGRQGVQVSRKKAVSGKIKRNWKQRLPLINIKRRPSQVPQGAAVYVWGGVIATGEFITDLDNPYSLVGYNAAAMSVWRGMLKQLLASPRCIQIRCLSEACREAVGQLFGQLVHAKTVVSYPRIEQQVGCGDVVMTDSPRFLFVGTQFEIKGGPELFEAFRQVRKVLPHSTLDVVTHLPSEYEKQAESSGIRIHEAHFSRDEIWARFMRKSDVLVHPSYMESFGMVVLEALSHGLAVIANDVYAHPEMVIDGENGVLLQPPVHYWDGVLAGPLFFNQFRARDYLQGIDKSDYINRLAQAMIAVAAKNERLQHLRSNSCRFFAERFSG